MSKGLKMLLTAVVGGGIAWYLFKHLHQIWGVIVALLTVGVLIHESKE